jgi:NAD(P)-dependent dehydrogenase (short-subunit alcohol dehydrogenase family)
MVVLITGASSGFGQLLARTLRARGHTVFGTSRYAGSPADEAPLVPLDVRSDASVAACVRQVEAAAGPVDVLVNNAGYVHEGPLEEFSIDELRAIFETNFFGAVRMTNAVLPSMRARKRGRIINLGSLAGVIPLPFVGAYCATKHAIDSYSESLYHELKPLGIGVSVVEPGYFSTGISTRKLRTTPSIADYDEQRARMYRTVAHDENARSGNPSAVVSLLTRIVEGKTTRLRHVVGPDSITYHLRGLVSQRVWEFGFRLATGLDRS